MLDQALVALAASGGTAVVTAAGTDAWTTVRTAVAGWFGRGDVQREGVELERLERTAAAVREAGPGEAERVGIRQEAIWQARFEELLESLSADEQERAVEELRGALAQYRPSDAVRAGPGGLAVGGNVEVRADGGSAAAVRMGDVTIGSPVHPLQPGPGQG